MVVYYDHVSSKNSNSQKEFSHVFLGILSRVAISYTETLNDMFFALFDEFAVF